MCAVIPGSGGNPNSQVIGELDESEERSLVFVEIPFRGPRWKVDVLVGVVVVVRVVLLVHQ